MGAILTTSITVLFFLIFIIFEAHLLPGRIERAWPGTSTERVEIVQNQIEEGINTYIGDSDLKGQYDAQDIVAAFIAGQYLSGGAAGWADGDWDGNLTFDDQDFVAAFIAGGYLQGPRGAASVPEPSGLVLLVLGALAGIRRRR